MVTYFKIIIEQYRMLFSLNIEQFLNLPSFWIDLVFIRNL